MSATEDDKRNNIAFHDKSEQLIAQTFPVGRILEGGWAIAERCGPERCGRFSYGFLVKHPDGRKGFLKALNYEAYLYSPNPDEILKAALEAYHDETRLLNIASKKRLSRIVSLWASGSVKESDGRAIASYMIFELADDDGRQQFDAKARAEYFASMSMLHDVAVGVHQLHQNKIVHQDLSGRNVLCFKTARAKIADLGRAMDPDVRQEELCDAEIAGDETFAPPELLYRSISSDWAIRRIGTDLYLLGSLITSFFLGAGMTPLIMAELPESLRPTNWNGEKYEDVLPYVRSAFATILQRLKKQLLTESGEARWADEVISIVRELCEPDPSQRGDKFLASRGGNRFSLERYVGKIDRLSKRANTFRTKAA